MAEKSKIIKKLINYMNTILVTGGAGFLGSHVANCLIQRGHNVVVIDDLSGGYRRNIPAAAEFYQASICDDTVVLRLFEQYHFRSVFHFAAYAAEGLSHHIRRFNYSNNILGSMTLINAAVKYSVEHFVYTSSIAVYGCGPLPFSEDSAVRPVDPYGIAKLAVEYDLQAAQRYFGLPYIIFRPHNIYGKGQNLSDPYRNVLGIFMKQVMDGKPCTIFGDGSQRRAFSYIDDVAPVIAQSIEFPSAQNSIFNIGADATSTVMQVAQMVQKALGKETGITLLPARNEVHSAYCDHRLAGKILAFYDKTKLSEGIEQMAEWAKTIQRSTRKSLPTIEIISKLPPSWNIKSELQ
jgi:UDP-glucose 4-epimerase